MTIRITVSANYLCINSQNIVCFFSDVVNTCVVYIEQATAGRGGGGSAAIYHRFLRKT